MGYGHRAIALTQLSTPDWQNALDDMKRHIELYPSHDPEAYRLRAWIHDNLCNHEGAERDRQLARRSKTTPGSFRPERPVGDHRPAVLGRRCDHRVALHHGLHHPGRDLHRGRQDTVQLAGDNGLRPEQIALRLEFQRKFRLIPGRLHGAALFAAITGQLTKPNSPPEHVADQLAHQGPRSQQRRSEHTRQHAGDEPHHHRRPPCRTQLEASDYSPPKTSWPH